jgi:antitoxin (DNA-binding transcriptional repressor) of toxin-antitoxin stability system
MIEAGIKDLKNRLSDYLRQVKQGEREETRVSTAFNDNVKSL